MTPNDRAKCIAETLRDLETIVKALKGPVGLKRAIKAHHECLQTHAEAMASQLSLNMADINDSAGGEKPR